MSLFENSNLQDQRLVEEMRRGSRTAEAEFYRKYSKKLAAFLLDQGATVEATAKENATEAIIEFWERYIKSEVEFDFGRGVVFSYLRQTAQNTLRKDTRNVQNTKEDLIILGNNEEPNASDPLEALSEEIDRKANKALESTGITLEIITSYMQNDEVFGDKCRELYAFDFVSSELNDFDKKPGEISKEPFEFEKSPKDIGIAKMMTAWSLRRDMPPVEYNPNWIRAKRKRCKERLLKAMDRDGYGWNREV